MRIKYENKKKEKTDKRRRKKRNKEYERIIKKGQETSDREAPKIKKERNKNNKCIRKTIQENPSGVEFHPSHTLK